MSDVRGKSVVLAPVIDHEEYSELSSLSTYPLEEVRERCIALLQNQPPRNALWKFYDNPPRTFVTPTIKPLIITDNIRRRFIDEARSQSLRPTEEVLEEIKKRVPRFLDYIADDAKNSQTETSSTEDPKDEDFDDPIDLEPEKSLK